MKDEERLTLKGCTECIANGWKDCDICSMGNNPPVIEKLAAYEDTGLSPAEVEELKHRAEIAEEALSIAGEHICDNCDIDCNSKNCFAGRMYLIDYFKQQAEEMLKEAENDNT